MRIDVGAGMPEHEAETAWVAQAQRQSRKEQVNVVVGFGRGAAGNEAQAARHAEVDQQVTGVPFAARAAQQQVLAAPMDRFDAQAGKRAFQAVRYGLAEGAVADDGAGNGLPLDFGSDAEAADFDFGQFGHVRRIAARAAGGAGAGKVARLSPLRKEPTMRPNFSPLPPSKQGQGHAGLPPAAQCAAAPHEPDCQPMNRMPKIRCQLLLPALAAALSVTACAGVEPKVAAAPAAEPAPVVAAVAEPAAPVPQLDGRTVYQVLLGEIAIQRGEAGIAAHAYADAARRTGDLGVLTRAIQIAGAARQYDIALQLTRQWVAGDPGSVHARQSMVGILAALGRGDELEETLRELLAADAESRPRNLLHMSRLFAAEPDRALAMRRVYALSEPYLDLPESHYTRAAVAHSAGQREAALKAVRRASELRDAWDDPWQLEIQILGPEGAAEASERVSGYLARHPQDVSMRMQLARLYATQRKWAEARAEFMKVAEGHDNASEALNAVALIAVQQRDYDAAEEIFNKLLATGSLDPGPLHHQLGLIAEDRRQFDKALEHLRQVGDGEYRIAAQSRIGIVLAKSGRVDEAIAHLRSVPTFNAEERQRLVLAEAQVLREAKDFKGAFEVLSKALEREPNQPDLLYDHAMIAERIERFDVLEGNLNKLITLDPENAHAYNALGYTFADRNIRLEEARKLILKALELAPDDVFIIDSMGWVLFRLGDVEGALRNLERAWSLRRDPEIAAHLGEVLWAAGRRDEAKKIWREARAENPDNEVLASVIEKYLK